MAVKWGGRRPRAHAGCVIGAGRAPMQNTRPCRLSRWRFTASRNRTAPSHAEVGGGIAEHLSAATGLAEPCAAARGHPRGLRAPASAGAAQQSGAMNTVMGAWRHREHREGR
jgi:hypothetical protein